MGRAPCCDKANVKKGPWSPEEDAKLKDYIDKYGTHGNWIALPHKAGLKRCGKSCRLRWLNYLRPDIKHGEFSEEEDRIIYSLYASIGSRWSKIAAQLPGRTDNDVKNYWNTKLKKKLAGSIGIHQPSHRKPEPPAPTLRSTSSLPSPYYSLSSLMHVNSSTFSSNFNHYYHLNPSTPALTALDLFLPPLSIATTGTSTPSPSPTTGKPSLFQTSHGCVNSMNFLRFGGEVSCSCSDRSSRQIKQEEEEEEEMGGFQDFLCTRVQGSDYQKADVDSVCGSSHECKM